MNETLPRPAQDRLAGVRRIVLKVGTSLIDHAITRFNYPLVFELTAQIKTLMDRGIEVVLVTSGAVGSGMRALGIQQYPTEIERKQALAAIGQPFLMHQYGDIFSRFGLQKAQLLLTRSGLEDRRRYLHARGCLEELLRLRVVPIINENDTVVVDELRFGDNDQLSAIVAAKLNADVLLILTDVDGLFTSDPRKDPAAERIPVVESVTPDLLAMAGGKGSVSSSGGMHTKLLAARLATANGVLVGIANGRHADIVLERLAGRGAGTWFLPGVHTVTARRRWMTGKRPLGTITVDEGASRALVSGGKSLLPVGITATSGEYDAGDLVRVCGPDGRELAVGIAGFSAEEVRRAQGHGTDELEAVLGYAKADVEVIHRDNMVLLVQP